MGERLTGKQATERFNEIGDTGDIYIYLFCIHLYFYFFSDFVFWYKTDGKWMAIDATSETITAPARLINHSKANGNLKVKICNCSIKHLYFVAKEKITAGTQLMYDYNDTRKHVISNLTCSTK